MLTRFYYLLFYLIDDKHTYLKGNAHLFKEMSIDISPSANIITKKQSKNWMLTK